MTRRWLILITAFLFAFTLTAGNGASAASANQGWKDAYRQLISSGKYQSYLSPNVPASWGEQSAWKDSFNSRDRRWDAFALHDMNGDGIPELIVMTEFGVEQADVFTWNGSRVVWLGSMGGDNFFQEIVFYDQYGYSGLFTVMGGPVMTITRYTLANGRLIQTRIGQTKVDANGDYTIGIRMDVNDQTLYDLLYGTYVGYRDLSRSLQWFRSSDLQTSTDWNFFFSSARS